MRPSPGGRRLRPMAMAGRRGGLGARGALGFLALLLVGGCAVNPVTGRRQLALMTEGQEIQMGREADPEITAGMGLYPDEELQRYIHDLGVRLAAVSERPGLPWTFRVLDDPLINAFALPGGFIYVTRGIMAYFESEAELVGVLGHEIGHVTARHSVHRISRAQLAQLGLAVGVALAPELQRFEGVLGASMQLLFLKYSRDDERQADELGVRYTSRLGYRAQDLAGVMAMLGEVAKGEGGGGRPPEWLSTHPNPENREEAIVRMAASTPPALDPPLVRREEYLQRLDGVVFGENPRHGFFQEREFLHPDLRFRLSFPAEWRTANSRQAVQGVSPGEDALLLLTLGEGTSPAGALRGFLAQEGVRGGVPREETLNGLPAASAGFAVETKEGTLQGRVSFVGHGDSLFRLLGLATTSAWPGRQGVIRAALESFRPLTDPALLNVQPTRLRVVRVPRAMTLDAFLESQGATRFGEEARLLNRLRGDPTLEAGRLLKVPR